MANQAELIEALTERVAALETTVAEWEDRWNNRDGSAASEIDVTDWPSAVKAIASRVGVDLFQFTGEAKRVEELRVLKGKELARTLTVDEQERLKELNAPLQTRESGFDTQHA